MEAEAETSATERFGEEAGEYKGVPGECRVREGTSGEGEIMGKGYYTVEGKYQTFCEEATERQAVYHVA